MRFKVNDTTCIVKLQKASNSLALTNIFVISFRIMRTRSMPAVLLGALAVMAWVGCSSTQSQGPKGPEGGNVPEGPKVDMARCDQHGKRVQNLDTNGDGKPDVWKLYQIVQQSGQDVDVLTCKQVDLNHDGKVDEVVVFNDAGNRVMEKFDLDFDGKFDVTVYYEGGHRVREELDTNYDGKPDVWKYYEGDKLVRVELDRDHNGRVDQWEYFEGGKLDRIGYDESGSGQVERWDRQPSDTAPPEAAPPGGAAPAAAGGASPGTAGEKQTPPGPPPTAPAPDKTTDGTKPAPKKK
jgi:hypothetical protein